MKNNQKYYNSDKQLEMAYLIISELLKELKGPSKNILRGLVKEFYEQRNNLENQDYPLNVLILNCTYFISKYKIRLTTKESFLFNQLNEILHTTNQ